jgi:tetratricopeptide (TPR) repeat protein
VQAGQTLGHYRILERLGAGGMGVVYKALDTRLNRVVALKALAPDKVADPDRRRRFIQEAQAASALDHPNIVTIHDIAELGGQYVIVMQYVEGRTLRALLEDGPRPVAEVLRYALQITDALGQAHAKGIVHRDLKPENVMITSSSSGQQGQVKLLDFGLAKLTEPASGEESTAATAADTAEGRILGSTSYMSPEQAQGKKVDARSDIFALGSLLYELLAGRPAFPGENALQVLAAIVRDEPAPLEAPAELATIVGSALKKNPAERWPTMADLRGALLQVPPGGAAPGPWARWLYRAAAVLLVVSLGAAAWWLSTKLRTTPPAVAERAGLVMADLDNTTPEARFDATAGELLAIALQQSPYVNLAPRARLYESLRRMRRAGTPQLDEATARELCLREGFPLLLAGSIHASGARFQISVRVVDALSGSQLFTEQEQFSKAEDLFQAVEALAARVRTRLGESGRRPAMRPLQQVTTGSLEALQHYSRALEAYARGQVDGAAVELRAAVARDPDFAMAHRLLARVYLTSGNREKEREHLERAYALRQDVGDRERHFISGSYYSVRGDYQQAVESFSTLVSLYPNDAEARHELALAYSSAGNPIRAISELREELRVDPNSAQAYASLTLMLARQNRNEEALAASQEAAGRGLESPRLAWGAGLALLGLGRAAEARERFEKVAAAGESHQSTGRIYLARTDIYEGKFAAAAARLEEGIRLDQRAGLRSPELLQRSLLGRLYLLLGRALAARSQADAIINASGAGPLQAEDLRRAGVIYARLGDRDAARKALHGIIEIVRVSPTPVNQGCYYGLQGEIALAEKKPQAAVEAFRQAEAKYPEYLVHQGLARAWQQSRDPGQAATEWQHVLEARGEVMRNGFPADWVLAHLELARAWQDQNLPERAAPYAQEFARLWKDADASAAGFHLRENRDHRNKE